MAVNPGDIMRVTAVCSAFGQKIENVYHVRHAGFAALADSQFDVGIATDLDTAYGLLVSSQNNNLSYDEILIYNVTQGTPTRSTNWITLLAGTNVVSMLPMQCAALGLFRSSRAKSMGRKYIGGFAEDRSAGGGQLEVLAQTDMLLYVASILLFPTINFELMQYGNWDNTLAQFSVWVSASVDTYFRTQRRRVVGVGV